MTFATSPSWSCGSHYWVILKLILNNNRISQEKDYVIFNRLYLRAKYEPAWLDLALKIVSFSAYFLRQICSKMCRKNKH